MVTRKGPSGRRAFLGILPFQQYVLRGLPDAILGDVLRTGGGVPICEADSLFTQFIIGDYDSAGCFEQFVQFLVWLDVSNEWFSIRHDAGPLSPSVRCSSVSSGCNNISYSNNVNSLPTAPVNILVRRCKIKFNSVLQVIQPQWFQSAIVPMSQFPPKTTRDPTALLPLLA